MVSRQTVCALCALLSIQTFALLSLQMLQLASRTRSRYTCRPQGTTGTGTFWGRRRQRIFSIVRDLPGVANAPGSFCAGGIAFVVIMIDS